MQRASLDNLWSRRYPARMNAASRMLVLVTVSGVVAGTSAAGSLQAPAHGHVMVQPAEITWRPLRPGAEIAVVSGDPDTPGAPFVMRMRYTGVVRVPPHWHPTDEHITVLSGTFVVGMGERSEEKGARELIAGAYAWVPAKMSHYAWSKGDTVVQVHGLGPFAINYVNPSDDPGKKTDKR
jgi:mannose-6-phosphate isomerase-like protein (cupin superfamily)